jgi:hypothetical protein
MDRGAAVVDAVTDHRPAIVLALADDVDFIAAARAVLDFPEIAGRGVDRQSLLVAMAKTPDLGPGAIASDKGIVRRRCAIGRDPDQLAQMIAEVLRLVAIAEVFAECCEQIAVVGLHDAAAVMIA